MEMSIEDRAGAFLDAAATAGDIELMKHMSLLFPTARGEKYHERALRSAIDAGQIEAAETLIKIGVDTKVYAHTLVRLLRNELTSR
jgi:hypothetical protein